jgi:hypothetical protein
MSIAFINGEWDSFCRWQKGMLMMRGKQQVRGLLSEKKYIHFHFYFM